MISFFIRKDPLLSNRFNGKYAIIHSNSSVTMFNDDQYVNVITEDIISDMLDNKIRTTMSIGSYDSVLNTYNHIVDCENLEYLRQYIIQNYPEDLL